MGNPKEASSLAEVASDGLTRMLEIFEKHTFLTLATAALEAKGLPSTAKVLRECQQEKKDSLAAAK